MKYQFTDREGQTHVIESRRKCSVCLIFTHPGRVPFFTASRDETTAAKLAREYSRLHKAVRHPIFSVPLTADEVAANATYAAACVWYVAPLTLVSE